MRLPYSSASSWRLTLGHEYQVILLPWQWSDMPVHLQDLLRDPAGTKREGLTSALERGVVRAPEADEVFSFHENVSMVPQRYKDSVRKGVLHKIVRNPCYANTLAIIQ